MRTYRFAFKQYGLDLLIEANTIFDAMVEFHALHSGSILDELDELLITKEPQ